MPVAAAEADELRGLDAVRVSKESLADVIKKNRDDHRAIFEEAIENWKARVTQALEEAVADAKAGREYRVTVGLVKPTDHTAEYDRVLKMLEMSLDDELELDAREFANYVMDDWGWQRDFLTSASMYVNSASNTQLLRSKAGQ